MEQTNLDLIIVEEILLMDCLSIDIVLLYYFFFFSTCFFFFLSLQVFLDHRPRDEVHQLVSARTNGATPLVLSCRNGHKDVVEYLVERCNADVEQPGKFWRDNSKILL